MFLHLWFYLLLFTTISYLFFSGSFSQASITQSKWFRRWLQTPRQIRNWEKLDFKLVSYLLLKIYAHLWWTLICCVPQKMLNIGEESSRNGFIGDYCCRLGLSKLYFLSLGYSVDQKLRLADTIPILAEFDLATTGTQCHPSHQMGIGFHNQHNSQILI